MRLAWLGIGLLVVGGCGSVSQEVTEPAEDTLPPALMILNGISMHFVSPDNEHWYADASESLDPTGGELCLVHVAGSLFEEMAGLVREGRVGAAMADDGQMDGVDLLVRANDGRTLTFAFGGIVRDVDGGIYRLDEEAERRIRTIEEGMGRVIFPGGACLDVPVPAPRPN